MWPLRACAQTRRPNRRAGGGRAGRAPRPRRPGSGRRSPRTGARTPGWAGRRRPSVAPECVRAKTSLARPAGCSRRELRAPCELQLSGRASVATGGRRLRGSPPSGPLEGGGSGGGRAAAAPAPQARLSSAGEGGAEHTHYTTATAQPELAASARRRSTRPGPARPDPSERLDGWLACLLARWLAGWLAAAC